MDNHLLLNICILLLHGRRRIPIEQKVKLLGLAMATRSRSDVCS